MGKEKHIARGLLIKVLQYENIDEDELKYSSIKMMSVSKSALKYNLSRYSTM
jgi:hypothetical protein